MNELYENAGVYTLEGCTFEPPWSLSRFVCGQCGEPLLCKGGSLQGIVRGTMINKDMDEVKKGVAFHYRCAPAD
jgi:hypothetical protein